MPDQKTIEFTPTVTDRDVERYLCGEADAALCAHIESTNDPALRACIAARRAHTAAFYNLHPRLPVVTGAPSWRQRLSQLRLLTLSGVAVAACALLVVALPRARDDVRTKGAAPLQVSCVVKRGERQFALHDGALLREQDALALEVVAERSGVLVVAVHEHDSHSTSVLVAGEPIAQGKSRLRESLILDAHRGAEELWVVFAADASLATALVNDIMSQRLRAAPAGAVVVPFVKEP